MKWSRFIISMALLAATAATALASDITSLPDTSRYGKRAERYRQQWAALIPTQFVIQNAGNMGAISAGFGWNYGKHGGWETNLLFGYIPKYHSHRGKLTITLKENYIPWSLPLGHDRSFEPLTASLYLNTVCGHEFWRSQPNRYPDGYYQFMSTKFRINAALGQRFTWHIPQDRRRHTKSVSLFYEVSTCDLYVRAKYLDHSIPLKDILTLSLGVKLQTL